jgi:hypothetical protein
MSDDARRLSWREVAATAALVFLIVGGGCLAAFAVWTREVTAPQVVVLGSGNRLSVLVTDGPARLLLATGDNPIEYENALTRARPLFARRLDVLLIAGEEASLLVPLAAAGDRHVRVALAIAPLPPSAESDAIGPLTTFAAPRRVTLGPSVTVTIESAMPFGADENETFPSWRATIEHGETRVVVFSDGEAATLFPPDRPASVLVVSGNAPVSAWDASPAVALVANGEEIDAADLRESLRESRRLPAWNFLVHSGEALRLKFVPGGIEIASESALAAAGTRQDASPVE